QRSIDREILRRNFPGQPALAWFTLANEDTEDLDKYTQRIAALATAGYTADPAEVSETLGLTLTHQPAQPPMGPFGNRAPALLANDDYTRDTNGKFSETQGGGAAKQDPDPPTSTTSDTPDFSQPASLTSDQAADYLSKNPNSPHARAMSLWAEDAEPYSRMISANDSISADWRAKCAETINSVKPDTSGATVNRGWQFKRKEQRDHVLNQVLSEKGFENTRPGMSASYDSKVS
ncbi:MAG: hypothetical protein LBD14_00155, partial [Puniceicoccales bacterium]|nr:hypothetical protein [Puniceicoccales bacterium]